MVDFVNTNAPNGMEIKTMGYLVIRHLFCLLLKNVLSTHRELNIQCGKRKRNYQK